MIADHSVAKELGSSISTAIDVVVPVTAAGDNPRTPGCQIQKGPRRASGHIVAEKSSVVFERYYHLFHKGELETLAANIADVSISQSFYDKSNWCVVLQKER